MSLVIALFTLIITDSSFEPSTDQTRILVQDLIAFRIWIVVIGLAFFRMEKRYQPAHCGVVGRFS